MSQDNLKKFLHDRGLFYGWKIFTPSYQQPQQQEEPLLLNLDFGLDQDQIQQKYNQVTDTTSINSYYNQFPQYHYYCVDTNITNLLDQDEIGFIMQPAKRGISDLVQFEPEGQFTALLIKQSYREFGIVGKKINEDLFLVSLNIKQGKNALKNLDRLKEGFSRQNQSNKFMVVKSNEDGSSAGVDFQSGVKFVRNPSRFSSCKLHGKNMCVPIFPPQGDPLWNSKALLFQVFNYFGNLAVVNTGCDYIEEMKKFQTRNSFNCVEISFWQGLFLPVQIYNVIVMLNQIVEEQSLPWIAASVYGFQNGVLKVDARDDFFVIIVLGKGQYMRFSSESDGRGNENIKVIKGQLL